MSDNPSAGDIGIIEHAFMYEAYQVVRVAKIGKVMWEVCYRIRPRRGRDAYWSEPARRKVSSWIPLPADADPDAVAETLSQFHEEFRAEEKRARESFIGKVKSLAAVASEERGA